MRRSLLLLPVIATLAALILWAASLPALAHAALVSTSPPDGAVLEQGPAAVDLTFSEPVSPLAATLVRPDGTSVHLDDIAVSGAILSISIPAGGGGQGTSVLSYRVVSDDGHPIAGAIVFSVGAVSGTVQAVPQSDTLASFALWLSRAVTYIALFVGVGGTGFRVIAPLPPAARLVIALLVPVGLAGALATIGLQGLDSLGKGLPALVQPGVWTVGFSSPYGATSAVEVAALLAGLVSLLSGRRVAVATSALAIVLTGLAVALSGHAAAAEPQWLTRTAVFLHITSIAWWVGGLFPLALVLRQGRRVSARPLIRFSRLIPFAIFPLILSGSALAVVQLGWPGPAWLTPYGLILAAKLILLALLFSIASWNRWVLTGPAARGDLVIRTHMQGTIFVELFMIFAVLALVAGWRFTPPPRAIEAAEAAVAAQNAGTEIQLTNEGIAADVTLASGRAGANAARVVLTSGGSALTAKGVVISLSQPTLGIQPFKTTATLSPNGVWTASPVLIPVAGTWHIELQVRVSDFKLVRLAGEINLEP